MTKKPSYRFAGYTEPWEEKKLGDFVEISKGIQRNKEFLSPNADSKNCYPVYNGGKQESGYTDEFNREGNIMISEGGASAGFVNYFDGKYWSGGHNFTIDELENDIYYVLALLESQQQELYSLQVGSGLPNIQLNSLKKVIITFPAFLEQQAIGSFFQDIDQLISLQQRKLEVLKEQKKTYLKLLFPAKGQTKPALRFAGFEDEWKEVKLGEIGEIQTGNTPSTNEEDNYEKNGFPWVTPTDINSLVLHTTSKQLSEVGKSKARIAKSGSILVTCIASIGKNTLVRTDSAFNQQINSLTPSEKYSSYFLLTQSEIWSRYMLSVAGAGTMQIINKSDFSNIKAMVPTLPEQEVIGSFFQDLDKAIAKQEEKVNQLKESKQTLLRKMFI